MWKCNESSDKFTWIMQRNKMLMMKKWCEKNINSNTKHCFATQNNTELSCHLNI